MANTHNQRKSCQNGAVNYNLDSVRELQNAEGDVVGIII